MVLLPQLQEQRHPGNDPRPNHPLLAVVTVTPIVPPVGVSLSRSFATCCSRKEFYLQQLQPPLRRCLFPPRRIPAIARSNCQRRVHRVPDTLGSGSFRWLTRAILIITAAVISVEREQRSALPTAKQLKAHPFTIYRICGSSMDCNCCNRSGPCRRIRTTATTATTVMSLVVGSWIHGCVPSSFSHPCR